MKVIELIFSIVIPLLIAFLTVYLDRLLLARKEHKRILGSILSEVEVNLGIIQQLKKQLKVSKKAPKSGGILTTPLFMLHEDSMKFAQAQGLVLMLDKGNYGAISMAYVIISNVNQCINNYEALKLVPTMRREKLWDNLIVVIEERFNQLEPLLVGIREALRTMLKLG